MSCIIKIFTGNDLIEVEVPSLPSSLSELKNILKQNNKFNELNSSIRTAVSGGHIINSQVLSKIKESGNIIPNTTVLSVQNNFPDIEFPQIELLKIPILFINNYSTVDNELLFGVLELNGEQIYVLDNNKIHVLKFAAYLKLKTAIELDNILEKLSTEAKQTLEECRKASNYHSTEEMVLLYLNNKNIFRNFKTSEGISVFSTLNKFLTELNLIVPSKNRFENPTVLELWLRLTPKYDSKTLKFKEELSISLEELYDLVLMSDENIQKVIPNTFLKFKNFINSDKLSEDFTNLFGDNPNKLEAIVNYFNNIEPWLNLELISLSKDQLTFKKLFPSVNRVFGIGYDEISKMKYQEYRGYFIFEKDGKFYISKQFLTPLTRSEQYDSLEDVQNYLDLKVLNEELFKDTNLEYGRRKVEKRYLEGSLVRIKDYNVSNSYIKNKSERELKTLQEFYNYFNDNLIQSLIQNAEDATLFLRKINEFSDRSLNKLVEIAKEIHDAPYTYYYIEKSYKDADGKLYQRAIPAKEGQIEEFLSNYKIPVIQVFNSILNVLGKKFGLNIEILSNSEVELQYNVTNAKAFIIGDKIILNSTLASSEDLFHEYSHIILGYLKNKNYEGYRNLIELVWKLLPDYTRNFISKHYQNLPMESKMEEGFVYQFGKYISDNFMSKDLSNIFKESENFLKEGTVSIFDGETDILKLFGTKIGNIFNRFNQEIASMLNTDNDFLSFSKSNDFFLLRKKVNWLEKQIESKNIIEKC